MELEELEDAEDDVVDVAEAGGLALLGVVEAAGPVDGDVGVAAVELDGGPDGAAGGGLAELVEALEDGAVFPDVEAADGAGVEVGEGGGGADGGEEGDVVVGVEAAEGGGGGGEGAGDLHAAVEGVVDDEAVGHADAVGLHRVALPVVVVADRRLVEVAHAPPVRRHRRRRSPQRRPLPLPRHCRPAIELAIELSLSPSLFSSLLSSREREGRKKKKKKKRVEQKI